MSDIQIAIQAVLGVDNAKRREAEEFLDNQRKNNPGSLVQSLFEIMRHQDPLIAQFACVYIKKAFTPSKAEEEDTVLPRETFETIKNNIFDYVDFNKQGAYLQSLGFLIVKVYAKLEQFVELMAKTVEWGQSSEPLARSFAMYLIEVLADVHMPVELFKKYVQDFANIFQSGLNDSDVRVKVSTLKAASAFLTSIEDKNDVKDFAPIIEPMINAIIDALQNDEKIGRKAMDSFIVLSEYHPILFVDYIGKLVSICSQITENKDFESGTRAQAQELVCVLTEIYPALIRKCDEAKTMFIPALFRCLTEVELPEDDEQEEWLAQVEEDDASKSDVHTVTKLIVARFSSAVQEKTILLSSNEIIKEAITNPDWRVRVAGYSFLGYLAESCKDAFKVNLDEIMRMAASGVIDPHPRVQYAGIMCLGLMIAEQAPHAQKKYHQDILPQLISIMRDSPHLKIKSQATSATINFVRELIIIDEDNFENVKRETSVMENYNDNLLDTCASNLQLSLTSNFTPLQEETLALLACIAQLIQEKFEKYYPSFMPGLKSILANTPNDTQVQKTLKSSTI